MKEGKGGKKDEEKGKGNKKGNWTMRKFVELQRLNATDEGKMHTLALGT